MIEKILERLEAESKKWLDVWNDASKKGIIDNYADGMNDGFDEAISIVKEVAGKDTNVRSNGWIPCSERMPKEYEEVLVYGREGYTYIAELYDTKIYGKVWRQWNGEDLRLDWVIAWQPLPAPYQKGE